MWFLVGKFTCRRWQMSRKPLAEIGCMIMKGAQYKEARPDGRLMGTRGMRGDGE